ncbi:MAG: hypothetical protein K2G02_03930, partial [Phocaeicola sp.]|nr:hypothetical protein [Phocaeicola sp.]
IYLLLVLLLDDVLHLEKQQKRHVASALLGFGKKTVSHMELTLQLASVQLQSVQTPYHLGRQTAVPNNGI